MTADERDIDVLHLYQQLEPFESRPVFDALTGGRLGLRSQAVTLRLNAPSLLGQYGTLRDRIRTARLVQCWDDGSLLTAACLGARRIVFRPQTPVRRRTLRWLRAVSAYRPLHVACPTVALHRRLLSRGLAADRVHVLRPGVDFAKVRSRRDPVLRQALGIQDNDRVVLVPGAATDDWNHRLAVWAGSILRIIDPRVRLLSEGVGPWSANIARLAAKLGQTGMLIQAASHLGGPPSPDRLLAAADAVLVSATGLPPTLPIAYCMAAGLPIVSVVTPVLAELLEDRHTALMVAEPKARLLAQKMLTLNDDPLAQARIREQARGEAYELWPLSKSLAAWREFYEQVAEQT